MKASPVQLLQLMFKHVKVEIDPEHLPAEVPNPLTSVFTFDGVGVHSEVGIGEPDPDHEQGTLFFVGLRVVVDNVPDPERLEQKFAPYKVDVAAEGVFLVPKSAEQQPEDAEDLAVVNGASMLWSAVREQVSMLTSRMRAGPVVLPTVQFHDLKRHGKTDQQGVATAAAKQGRRSKKSSVVLKDQK